MIGSNSTARGRLVGGLCFAALSVGALLAPAPQAKAEPFYACYFFEHNNFGGAWLALEPNTQRKLATVARRKGKRHLTCTHSMCKQISSFLQAPGCRAMFQKKKKVNREFSYISWDKSRSSLPRRHDNSFTQVRCDCDEMPNAQQKAEFQRRARERR